MWFSARPARRAARAVAGARRDKKRIAVRAAYMSEFAGTLLCGVISSVQRLCVLCERCERRDLGERASSISYGIIVDVVRT